MTISSIGIRTLCHTAAESSNPVRRATSRAKSMRRYTVRIAKRAQKREREERSGCRLAIDQVSRKLTAYIPRPSCLRIHPFSLAPPIPEGVCPRRSSLFCILFNSSLSLFVMTLARKFSRHAAAGPRGALGRHTFPRIGRIRNYPTTVACGASN